MISIRTIFSYFLIMLLFACGSSRNLPAINEQAIQTQINLNDISNDRVMVELNPGALRQSQVNFLIPKTVPGTYSTDNYGKYIEEFNALDYKGDPLPVRKIDENTWSISNATKLDRLTYYVNDTYDTETQVEEAVFSPAGTNIAQDSVFVLNLHGFVGYFKEFQEQPYTISITAPESLEPISSLEFTEEQGKDIFRASRYFEVIDNPIMYSKPNSISFSLEGITVNLSVYSPTGVYKAKDLEERMKKMMKAQKDFLGEVDGTSEYNIILYLSTNEANDATGYGALEHHTSTVVVLPEAMPQPQLEEAMVDVVSHEFFHIVTPLNVHSEEVQYFDFNAPEMSRHLWMYEGTTEYFANLFQVTEGLIPETEFYERMVKKMQRAQGYDDEMSFTELSRNILQSPYEENYANVYEKGALINMALDLVIREQSQGERGVLWLMKTLSAKYDQHTPFEDEKLIPEIVELTYPEVQTFFEKHVIGRTPIPYEKYLHKVGLTIQEVQEPSGFFFHGEEPFIDVKMSGEQEIFVRKGVPLNSSFKELGLEEEDVILEVNDAPLNMETARSVIGASFLWTPDADLTIKVRRDGEEITLKGKAGTPTVKVKKILPMGEVSDSQLALRKAWLGKTN